MQNLKEFYCYKRFLKSNNFSLEFNKNSTRLLKFSPLNEASPMASLVYLVLHVKSTLNNTFVTLTDMKGKILYVKSCGSLGFNNKKKRVTKFAIESTLDAVISKIKGQKINKIFLCLNGFAKSRYAILKCLRKNNIKLFGIKDITPNPHNGCKPKKIRRV